MAGDVVNWLTDVFWKYPIKPWELTVTDPIRAVMLAVPVTPKVMGFNELKGPDVVAEAFPPATATEADVGTLATPVVGSQTEPPDPGTLAHAWEPTS